MKKKKRRSQEARSAATRQDILAAAINCISERGLAGATVPQIVKQAGVTTGAVQHHYGSRDELLIAVVSEFADKIGRRGRPENLQALSEQERIRVICSALWEAFCSPDYIAITEIMLGLRSQRESFRKIETMMQTVQADLDAFWIAAFADSGIKPAELATARHVFQAAFRGLALRRVFQTPPERWERERRILEELIALYLSKKR